MFTAPNNVFCGSRDAATRHAVQFPSNDPTVIIPAMAYATRTLGFGATYSTTCFPPYHTAKLFSTLDHLTRGRIGWNIVTSYLADALASFGIHENPSHDERDVFTDPRRVHQIDHLGKWFQVPGSHMCEPSRQRTPPLF